ncbi:MAG: 16S rRNA (cytidine(1402)-2'-O)-methyltransferase [Polyangiales bacterium]
MSAKGPGTLFVVSTPIGNLDDITLRATKTLGSCDAILAEDTRRTRKLLGHLGIEKPMRTFNAHADRAHVARVALEIAEGANLVLVSDAGTPLISDPGAELVRAVIEKGGNVVAVPGASAVLCALSASGLAGHGFRFFGFIPRSGGDRAEALARMVETEEAVVFYEAGNRVRDTILELSSRMPERAAAVARELTKFHEEFLRGTLGELCERLDPALLGEVTVVLGPSPKRELALDESAIDARIDHELAGGRGTREAADIVAAWTGRPRREIYARVIGRKR